jgi:L-rhamnose mutarotase
MQRVGFKMQLHPGNQAEYKKRHDEIWPELSALLKEVGVSDYSIFLEEATDTLFAYLTVKDKALMDTLPAKAVMKKWWAYMCDISISHADNSPVVTPLTEVFYLP